MIDRLDLPTSIRARDAEVLVRRATLEDLEAIIKLLSDDPISAGRGDVASDKIDPPTRQPLIALSKIPATNSWW